VGLKIRFQGGPRAGEVLEFGDDVELIALGRDPDKCQVVFPPEETKVSREHCAFKRVLGRYRLVLNEDNLVTIDGERAAHDELLEPSVDIQLGPDGPRLVVETTGAAAMLMTEDQGAQQTGTRTMMQRLKRVSIRAKVIAVVALLGLGGAVWWGSGELGKKQEEIERLESQLSNMTGEVETISEAQREAIRVATETKSRLEGIEQVTSPKLRETLRGAAPAVYLCIVRNDEGGESGFGTSWVAGRDVLATNAHVAGVYGDLQPGQTMWVRSSTVPPKTFQVESVTIHPGFEGAQEVLRRLRPYLPTVQGKEELAQKLGGMGFFDVALLHVAGGSDLGEPLLVVSDEDALKIPEGMPLGLVGYPQEGVVMVNPRQPSPQIQLGNVTSITNYLFSRTETGAGLLIQHSAPAAGGASGSPLLDSEGRVIALHNAANYVFVPDFGRINAGTGVSFGQRADLVRDLLGGVDRERVRARLRAWEEQVAALPSERDKPEDKLAALATSFSEESGGEGAEVLSWQGELAPAADGSGSSVTQTVKAEEAGRYLFAAVTSNWTDLDIRVADAADATIGELDDEQWFVSLARPLVAGSEVEVQLLGVPEGATVQLRVVRAGLPSLEHQRDRLVRDWAESKGVSAELDAEKRGVLARGGQQGRWESRFPVTLRAGVEYFLVALSEGAEDIDLELLSGGGPVAQNRDADWYPRVFGQVQTDTTFEAVVFANRPDVRWRFFLFKGADRTLDSLVEAWAGRIGKTAQPAGTAQGVLQRDEAAGAFLARIDARLGPPGDYLFVIIPDVAIDLDLRLLDEQDQLVAKDTGYAHHASVEHSLPAVGTVKCLVSGPQDGVGFTLHVYRAK
jgi:S1-C subfamily serine protease